MARLLDEEVSRAVTDGLRKIGYTYVTLDLLGFRSGSMNEGFFKKKRETHSKVGSSHE
jgi:pyridinium-3,5-biscarboxylic acid mononucleotide sulfurtransferase